MSPEQEPDSISVDRVEAGIEGTRFAGQVQHFRSIGSTNQMAIQAAQAGDTAGVYVADEQTAGRGRGGHTWHSEAGEGLYVSALATPELRAMQALWISLATGLAAQRAIAEVTGLAADLRWPNDLLLGDRKCGGILVETSVAAARDLGTDALLRYAVIGVGINVNHRGFPAELDRLATSLRQESGRAVSRERLLIELLRALDVELTALEAEAAGRSSGPGLLERFAEASTWVRGKRVRVEEDGGYTGVTAGLDPRGFLRVDGSDGGQRTVLSGGVRPLET